MTVDQSKPNCTTPNCPGCSGCSYCSDRKIPASLNVVFSGLFRLLTGATAAFDPTGLNGGSGSDFPLIFHDGVYITGYSTAAMGVVDASLSAVGQCTSVYEAILEFGDIFYGSIGEELDEDKWLRNAKSRVRIYVRKISATGWRLFFSSIIPLSGGFFELGGPSVVMYEWDQTTIDGEWWCEASGTFDIEDATSFFEMNFQGDWGFYSDDDETDGVFFGWDANTTPSAPSGYDTDEHGSSISRTITASVGRVSAAA